MKKNYTAILFVFAIIAFVSLGCSSISEYTGGGAVNSNQSLSNQAINATVGEEKLGIAECDELFDTIARMQVESQDDNFVTRGAKQYALNQVRTQIRQQIDQYKDQPGKRDDMARACREAQTQLSAANSGQTNNQQ